MKYKTSHGLGPGTLPKDVYITNYYESGYKTYFNTNRELTNEELKYYDIKINY